MSPESEYFTDVVLKLREESVHLDATVCIMGDNYTSDKRNELRSGIDKLLDDLYYVNDLLCVGKSCMNALVTQKILGLLVVPIAIPLMQLGKNTGVNISAATSLYLLSCLLQVVDKKEMLDSVASLILYPHVAPSVVLTNEADAADRSQLKPSSEDVNKIEQVLYSSLKSEETENDKSLGHVLEHKVFSCDFISCQWDDVQERKGILPYIFSDNQGLLFASLMLLFILAESNDLDSLLASVFGFPQTKSECNDAVVSVQLNGSIFMRCMPQILNALLKILGSASTTPVLIQWHTGWSLLKLITLQKATLSHQELFLFNVSVQLNASFNQARECLLNELRGCWFDYIPDTFKKEWTCCKIALEESSRKKDPFFILEVALQKESSGDTTDVWKRMIDAVKIFVLHLQLKAHILNGCLPDDPLKNLSNTLVASPRSVHVSDATSIKFGSQVPLGSGIPCKIAFSKAGVRDIFMIPVAKGISGKLLLVEKHPFHSRSGIVLAIAPLAGLTPKIDEKHATWLHLQVRDFNPLLLGKRSNLNSTNHEMNARWTLGFSDAEACEAACLLIAEETNKQRSFVESLLAPFLFDNYLGEEADSQGLREK